MGRRIVKLGVFILISIFVILFMSIQAYAETGIEDYAEAYGADVLSHSEYLSEEAAEFLKENGIAADDPSSAERITPSLVLSYMWDKTVKYAAAPLRLFALILGTVLISSLSGTVGDSAGKNTEQVYRIISVLVCVSVIVPYISDAVENASETLSDGSEFMIGYVPVMAGISAASGTVTAATSYNVMVLFVSEAAVRISSEYMMPLLSLCMAMGIIDAVNPGFSLSSITNLLKKCITVMICFVMTIFTGLLSIQSIVGSSADTLGVKAAKFVVANVVPVVGSAVADAYTTMRAGLGLLKGAAGAFGVIAAAVTLLPPIIESGLLYIAVSAGEAAAEMFGVKELAVLFRNTASVLSLIISLLFCFSVMFIVATIVLMAAGMGATG
ncbi:MAG: hypothetical protein ACI4KF_07435 [Huintestinicola sp.]